MTPWMRNCHKWLALLIGLQVALWMCSGVVMSLLDAKQVKGEPYRVPAPARPAWPADVLPLGRVLAGVSAPVRTARSGWLGDEPVYRLALDKQTLLMDARSGQPRVLEAALAQRIAAASYRGPGRAAAAELVPQSLETRAHPGPVWRVAFDDAEDTTVYVSREGDVLEHRNWSWRLFDIFWMLHIMDYTERKDFNSPWLIGIAIGAFWLALSGVWLLFTSFRRAEFVPARWRGMRALGVFTPEGQALRTVIARRGDTVFETMARAGLPLPSNCGGGQSCALCEVRVRGHAPPAPTAADRAQLGEYKLKAGHRLACNLPVDEALDIEVRGAAALAQVRHARVRTVRSVAPLLRELTLELGEGGAGPLWPGCYVQLMVPPYTLSRAQLLESAESAGDWEALALPASWSSRSSLRRSYSLALPTEQAGGAITLLVRFMSSAGAPPGRGSSWVHALKPGDPVSFSGPHGDFMLKSGRREKVFIGGGAGMAPLRAMVHKLLAGGATEAMRFWYGARSLRDAPYLEEMRALAARHANFRFELVLSGEPTAPPGADWQAGLVHAAAERQLRSGSGQLSQTEFYVCGPPAMLAATRRMLAAIGVPEANVAFDDFKI